MRLSSGDGGGEFKLEKIDSEWAADITAPGEPVECSVSVLATKADGHAFSCTGTEWELLVTSNQLH